MRYKSLSFLLGMVCVALAFNLYRFANQTDTLDCPELSELKELKYQRQQWLDRERELLSENGALVTENNELKMLTRKPLIIYKNVEESPINDYASEYYISILSERYK